MLQFEFDKLIFKEKLILIHTKGTEIDSLIPWTGNIRIATFYSIPNFFVELILDIETRKMESINTFKSIEFLENYPQYLDKINRNIKNELH